MIRTLLLHTISFSIVNLFEDKNEDVEENKFDWEEIGNIYIIFIYIHENVLKRLGKAADLPNLLWYMRYYLFYFNYFLNTPPLTHTQPCLSLPAPTPHFKLLNFAKSEMFLEVDFWSKKRPKWPKTWTAFYQFLLPK